ncbi:MAG: hypothetical protein HZA16_14175 [Nitrospirae bacterium]|nr:hypothetical protein [Nitrospirota bacterium]
MTLTELSESIKKICMGCKKCDPCCTGNVLKKCIENDRFAASAMNVVVGAE